jgi:hypothetical protein
VIVWLNSGLIAQDIPDQGNLTGQVLEYESYQPLINANVRVQNLQDSTFTYVTTDESGWFYANKLVSGKYEIVITYIGHKQYKNIFYLNKKRFELPTIYLKPVAVPLTAVEVVAQIPMAIQNGDTLDYLAKAIEISRNASAKDLVLRMMGFYNDNGFIMINGEKVENVLVDGKPFFKEKPLLTLETIPAEMIEKIQVYNKPDENTELARPGNESPTKTINIILKSDKKVGQFGEVFTGYGQKDFYQLGASLNSFGDFQRFTLKSQIKNDISTGDNTFGDIEMAVENNAFISRENGTALSKSTGITFLREINKKISVSGDYVYNNSNSAENNRLWRQYLADSTQEQEYFKKENTESLNSNHSFNLDIKYTFSDKDELKLEPSISIGKQKQKTISGSGLFQQNVQVVSTDNNLIINQTRKYVGGRFSYKHTFNNNKGSVKILSYGNYNNNENTTGQTVISSTPEDSTNKDLRMQKQSVKKWYSNTLTLENKIGSFGEIVIQAILQQNVSNTDNYTYLLSDGVNEFSLIDSSQSGISANDIATRSLSVFLKNNIGKFMLNYGTEFQNQTLKYQQSFPEIIEAKQSYNRWNPRITLTYNQNKSSKVTFTYLNDVQVPQADQISTILNNNNLEMLSVGNAGLKCQHNQKIFFIYSARNTLKNRYLNLNLYLSGSDSYIGNRIMRAVMESVYYNGIEIMPGAQLTVTENMDGYLVSILNASLGFPIKIIKSNMTISAGCIYNQTPGILNDVHYLTKRTSSNIGMFLNSNINKNIILKIISKTYIIATQYNQALQDNSVRINQQLSGELEWNLKRGFSFKTKLNYSDYNRVSSNIDESSIIWNMSFGKTLFKNQAGELYFCIFDILNNNKSLSRDYTDTYIEESVSNLPNRYAMLLFTYNIKHLPGRSAEPE